MAHIYIYLRLCQVSLNYHDCLIYFNWTELKPFYVAHRMTKRDYHENLSRSSELLKAVNYVNMCMQIRPHMTVNFLLHLL